MTGNRSPITIGQDRSHDPGTIRDYVLDLLLEDQRRPTTNDWLAWLRDRGPLVEGPVDAVGALHEARAERDRELAPWMDELGARLERDR